MFFSERKVYMNNISVTQKRLSFILKLIVVISAAVGIFLSAYAGRGTFMGGGRLFMYFTIQSNIAIALICAAGLCLLMRKKPVGSLWYVIKFI